MSFFDVIEVEMDGRRFDDLDDAMSHFAREADQELRKADAALRRDALNMLRKVHSDVAAKHANAWSPGAHGGPTLFRRTGQGLQDIYNSITVIQSGNTMEASARVAGYMAVHEEGATVTAKRSKYLTIPLPAALDSRGVPLKSRARDWDNTFVQRSKRGNLLIFQKRGDKIIPLYLLKTTVTIPARLGFGATFDTHLGYFETKAFERISQALEA